MVKGKKDPVSIFRFTGQLFSSSKRAAEAMKLQSRLVSWSAWPARTEITNALEAQLVHPEGPGGVVFIEGGSGSGKAAAVEDIKAWATSKGFALLCGSNMDPTSTFAVPWLC